MNVSARPDRSCCYGIDCSDAFVCVVRSARARHGLRHEVMVCGDPAAEREALARAAAEIRVAVERGRAWSAAALPVRDSLIRRLTAPFPSVAKARRVWPSLLSLQLPFPLEQCAADYLAMQPLAGGRVEALAVAARLEAVTAALARAQALGLDPTALDHEGLALWTAARNERPPADEGLRVAVYAGLDRTVLAVGHGDRFESAHASSWSARAFHADGREEGLREFAGRVARILQSSRRADERAATAWLWTGPAAEDDAFRAAVERALADLPLDPIRLREPAGVLARAMAERALKPDALPCSLRTGPLEHPARRDARRRRDRQAAAGLLAASLLLCALHAAAWSALRGVERTRQETLNRAARELSGLAFIPKGFEVAQAREALQKKEAARAPLAAYFDFSISQALHGLLTAARAQGLFLATLELQSDAVALTGSAPDWDRAARLQEVLEPLGYRIELHREEAGVDERVPFRLQGVKP